MKINKTRNKETDPTKRTIKELYKILDRNYFHICVDLKENNVISWKIYYKNLPISTYFSKRNQPLLTSEENSISDIYKLRDKFEYEKKVIIKNNYKEIGNIGYCTYSAMLEMKKAFAETIQDIALIIMMASVVNLLFTHNRQTSLFLLILIIFVTILTILKNKSIEKIIERNQKKFKEKYIEEKIKREGLYFVKRLKNDI